MPLLKMGYDDTRTIAVCNAGYGESFYSGAEDDDGQGNYGGEVDKGSAQDVSDAHTGNNALLVASGQDAFKVTVNHNGPTDKKFKISLWAKNGTHQNTKVNVGGTEIDHNGSEEIIAGNWVLLNFYTAVPNGTQVFVTANGGSTIVDDFRLHPLASSMTSYVYNEWDELTHIINSNNLATRYDYDCGGRLQKVFTEVFATNGLSSSGFKLVSQYEYTYKDGTNCNNVGSGHNNGGTTYDPIYANIGVADHNVNSTTININVNGGSGDFEYRWSVKYCTDPDPQDASVCPGNLSPNYGIWAILHPRTYKPTVRVNARCTGVKYVTVSPMKPIRHRVAIVEVIVLVVVAILL